MTNKCTVGGYYPPEGTKKEATKGRPYKILKIIQ